MVMDGEDDSDDAESSPDCMFPSYVPSSASCFPGDFDADEVRAEMLIKPDWSKEDVRGHRWLDGSWEAPTRGGGATQEEGPTFAARDTEDIHGGGEGEDAATKPGVCGVFSGNWGGRWKCKDQDAHMLYDAKSCPAHILTIQEAEEELFLHFKGPP